MVTRTKNVRERRLRASRKMAHKRQGGRRTNADQVLAQGTGRAAQRPFGSRAAPRALMPRSLNPRVWDAFHTAHAPLPRSVGPYTVIRTSGLLTVTDEFLIVGTAQVSGASTNGGPHWTNMCCVGAHNPVGVIGTDGVTNFYSITSPGGASVGSHRDETTFTCCPAAISVQVMGTNSLTDSAGQMAAAVVPTRLDLYQDTRSWADVMQLFVSYFRPRLMSGGKLALRGVQMDSFPLSMSEVSEFLPMYNDTTRYASTFDNSGDPHFRGWAPLCILNPASTELSLLVTVEWRVRFDIGHPAVASHSHHGVSSDASWDSLIQRASASLPGVCDIVEKVASTGLNLYSAGRAAALF